MPAEETVPWSEHVAAFVRYGAFVGLRGCCFSNKAASRAVTERAVGLLAEAVAGYDEARAGLLAALDDRR